MSNNDRAEPRAPFETSILVMGQLADVQLALVRLSVAVRSHLAEMDRPAPAGTHHQEAKDMAVAMTARELKSAEEALHHAFAPLRDQGRRMHRLMIRGENHTTSN